MTKDENGRFTITQQFVDDMHEWFRKGKTLHRRYVWEIVLGCYNELMKEESLTDIVLDQGMTCDVIGDIHGESDLNDGLVLKGLSDTARSIL